MPTAAFPYSCGRLVVWLVTAGLVPFLCVDAAGRSGDDAGEGALAVWRIILAKRCGRSRWGPHSLINNPPRVLTRLLVGQPPEPVRGDRGDDGEDTAGQVRAAGGGVIVGGVVKSVHAHGGRVFGGHAVGVQLLQRSTGEHRTGAD